MIWAVVLLGLVGSFLFVRLAPSESVRWHVDVTRSADTDFQGGAVRVIADADDVLARLDEVARITPRTTVLDGSVAAGHITYVTRSAIWGFPDYTTVQRVDGQLRLFARLRFGQVDLGVNRARLEAWLARVKS